MKKKIKKAKDVEMNALKIFGNLNNVKEKLVKTKKRRIFFFYFKIAFVLLEPSISSFESVSSQNQYF